MLPIWRLLLVLSAVVLAACGNGQTTTTVTLTGSSTIGPVMTEVARRYEAVNPTIRVDVQTGGSSRGIQDARTGLADIGMSSRALKPAEAEGANQHILARDGVAFLLHASNPVDNLSDDQLRDIYLGRISNWQQVGGKDAPITAISRANGRSELNIFQDYFGVTERQIKPDLIAGENQQGIKLVAGNPDAIIYMSIGTAETDQQAGVPIKLLPLAGVPASSQTVADGSFPMSRVLILVTADALTPAAKNLLDYALSPAVHDLIEAQAFVPAR